MSKVPSFAANISARNGHLCFAGLDTVELANQYKTPCYLMDEDRIRENCRHYTRAFAQYFPQGSQPLFASKANCFKELYRIMADENMGIDVVSPGEIFVAKSAGYPLEKAYFHGNCKMDSDIAFAMDCKVGTFVADTMEELASIQALAEERNIVQDVMLRITPGIDPHTYQAVCTGQVDSKFGAPIETGAAFTMTEKALSYSHINLVGFHCHVGSQVFGEDVYERTVKVMLTFIADVRARYGFTARKLNLGGGFGVPYVESDGRFDIEDQLGKMASIMDDTCRKLGLEKPVFIMEPGRSIVADAGMTLYTVGSVKRIPGYRNYVAIDGGMADNPRYALYESKYTCLVANRMDEDDDMQASIVGRCCESGDMIQRDVMVPQGVQRGDTVAVCTTGAYNYSMSSNYNRLAKPPVVMIKGGESRVVVRRQTFEDMGICEY